MRLPDFSHIGGLLAKTGAVLCGWRDDRIAVVENMRVVKAGSVQQVERADVTANMALLGSMPLSERAHDYFRGVERSFAFVEAKHGAIEMMHNREEHENFVPGSR
jgi:hypothetical protein